ncbi:MAG: DNA methylase [Oscillospiraceae bacterium]|nr:DNA methylase [Oscillospiraceae bacterium]
MSDERQRYIAIDLKSFYASVECADRGLDPLTTNLVVADAQRTSKTICLAVSPSLKSFGIPGRARLFEVIAKVRDVNMSRKSRAPGYRFTDKSYDTLKLTHDPSLEIDFITAKPRMRRYMQVSSRIYQIYLKYIAPEDIHVYSIDEVFIDAGSYLKIYKMSARELAEKMIHDVWQETGITATAGIGTNLYLCKIAMDIVAKKIPAGSDGVRIAQLDEMTYRQTLWTHTPLTDFWRVGKGISAKLKENRIFTMGDIARCSIGGKNDFYNEDLLYKLFGVNAELLIDHAWGWEPCTIADIKAYRPQTNSISSGQVLKYPYTYEKARLIAREMTDLLVLDLVDKHVVTDQMVLTVGYDTESVNDRYDGEITTDRYGRRIPKSAHGSINLGTMTSSTKLIIDAVLRLYDKIVSPGLLVRRMYVVASHVVPESEIPEELPEQLDFFTDFEEKQKQKECENRDLAREKEIQKAMLSIRKKFGKNAVLKGTNFEEGATTRERNEQVGGHKA